jgi:transcriptional regulator with XRE-family HTH domain
MENNNYRPTKHPLVMKIGKIIADLRKERDMSQSELANKTGISQVMVGKYERGDASPSVEVAKKIADVLGVSLDYLVGEGINSKLDKQALKRLQDLEHLEDDKKKTLFDLIDTYIRDAKTRKAHAA